MNTTLTKLHHYAEFVSPGLRDLCTQVIDHPLFCVAYGSAGEHHCYEGGLAIHTLEVLEYADRMSQMFDHSDDGVVITAAIFHDFMKIKEYTIPAYEERIVVHKTSYRNLVRHVAGSHAEFVHRSAHLTEEQLSSERRMKIEHAILAHHGRKEWGSPVEPQLVEAYILHFADQYSVKFGARTSG